jgi:hypothetical protein
MTGKKIKQLIFRYLLYYPGYVFLRSVFLTYRISVDGLENEREIFKKGNTLIYAAWHQRFLGGITFCTKRKPITVMISQSPDGEIISRILQLCGWHPVRGSSSRGGKEALHRIAELAHRGYRIGHVVDGPKGPFGVVKPGLIRLAQLTALPILPIIISPEKRWKFTSWDRFMFPKPFSRIAIRLGEAIYVPRELDESDFEKMRMSVQDTMKRLHEEADLEWIHDTPSHP